MGTGYRFVTACLAAACAAFATPVSAQRELSEAEAAASVPHYADMKQAVARGREMYRYDQAAWHATDTFIEDLGERDTSMMRGYFVVPGEGDRLVTVFYGEEGGRLKEFARYEVDGSTVVGGGLLPDEQREEVSPLGQRMIAAKGAAIEEAERQGYQRCNESSINTLILPADDGEALTVYLLTAPVYHDAYPIGGHYRIDVGADGEVTGSRRFLNTCFVANYGASQEAEMDGEPPVALVVSHLLDPTPTEIHVFASYYIPVELFVVTTKNEALWSLRGGAVGYGGPLDEVRGGGSRP